MEPEEVSKELVAMKVAEKAPNILQRGYIRTVLHTCRLVAGTDKSLDVQKDMQESLDKADQEVTGTTDETRAMSIPSAATTMEVLLKLQVSNRPTASVPNISYEDETPDLEKSVPGAMDGRGRFAEERRRTVC